jgi:preprotein translocase subunit SecF
MINFLKYRWLYFAISATVIGIGLLSIFFWGYNFSIDFVGGTNLEYQFVKNVRLDDVKKIVDKQNIFIENISLTGKDILLRTKPIDEKKELQLRNNLMPVAGGVIPLRFETVGPILGRETMIKTGIASLMGIFGILLYMTFAFKGFNFALSAVLALLHDFLVVIGSYSLLSRFFGAQVDTLFVTAVLTAMSFSVHDTIIIFDKIREYLREYGKGDIDHYANKALTETMVRSLNNSMTIIFMLLSLTLLGGSTIRFFVATLLVGTITGTYSSPFVATPILVWLEKRKK